MNNSIDIVKQELERKYNKASNKKAFEDKFLKLISEHSDEKQEEDEVDILQEFFDSYYYEGDSIYVNNFNNSIVIYLDDCKVKDNYKPALTFQRCKNYYKLTSGYILNKLTCEKNAKFYSLNQVKTFAKKYFKSFKLKYIRK